MRQALAASQSPSFSPHYLSPLPLPRRRLTASDSWSESLAYLDLSATSGVLGAAGDVDGDGREDLLVSEGYNNEAGSSAGKIWLNLSRL